MHRMYLRRLFIVLEFQIFVNFESVSLYPWITPFTSKLGYVLPLLGPSYGPLTVTRGSRKELTDASGTKVPSGKSATTRGSDQESVRVITLSIVVVLMDPRRGPVFFSFLLFHSRRRVVLVWSELSQLTPPCTTSHSFTATHEDIGPNNLVLYYVDRSLEHFTFCIFDVFREFSHSPYVSGFSLRTVSILLSMKQY